MTTDILEAVQNSNLDECRGSDGELLRELFALTVLRALEPKERISVLKLLGYRPPTH